MALDVLDAGPPAWDRQRRRAAWVRSALVLAVLLAALAADRWRHEQEVAQLLRATAAAEDVVRASQERREALTEQQSVLFNVSDDPPPPPTEELRAVAQDAALWLPRLAAPTRAVADVRVLPWHRDLRAARQAQLLRLRAWTREVRSTRAQPRRALRDAVEVRAAQDAATAALLEVADAARVGAALRP